MIFLRFIWKKKSLLIKFEKMKWILNCGCGEDGNVGRHPVVWQHYYTTQHVAKLLGVMGGLGQRLDGGNLWCHLTGSRARLLNRITTSNSRVYTCKWVCLLTFLVFTNPERRFKSKKKERAGIDQSWLGCSLFPQNTSAYALSFYITYIRK